MEDVVAVDVALRRNEREWFERLPPDGHFLCHVFHQDYLVKRGVDTAQFKERILQSLAARGGEYPAQHNFGRAYRAKAVLAKHYRQLDPSNCMNPGIGGASRGPHFVDGSA